METRMRALDPVPQKTTWRTWLWERRQVIGITVIVLLVAGGIFSRLESRAALRDAAKEAAIPTVAVAAVIVAPANEELVLPGNIQAFITAPIYARTSGYV